MTDAGYFFLAKQRSRIVHCFMIIFTDFDGTMAQNDVGDAFFRTFGDPRECEVVVSRWERNEISSRELYEIVARNTRVTRAQFEAFCATQELARGFLEFAAYCRERAWPLIVLSDGLEAYIRTVMQRRELALPVYSNHLEFIAPDRVQVNFPYWERSCGRCANCKRQHVEHMTARGQRSVYIGDGLSDRCGAQAADIIFAKDSLAEWCKAEGRKFYAFEDFTEVLEVLQEISL